MFGINNVFIVCDNFCEADSHVDTISPYSGKRNNCIPSLFQEEVSFKGQVDFFMLYSKWNNKGKCCVIEVTSVFSSLLDFIHHFELLKLICKSKNK